MSPAHSIAESTIDGHSVRTLASTAGELTATFAPGVGMVGCSLTHRRHELLGLRGGLGRHAETGSTMGIPLLHPWANRLSSLEYAVAGRTVRLDPDVSPVRLDPNGLPIHGLANATPYWTLTDAGADDAAARLSAALDYADHPGLSAGFPFPHELAVEVALRQRTLSIQTLLRPTGDVAVPVSFGYHPYFALTGVPRAEWEIELGVRRRALLDERGIPTGDSEPVDVVAGPLGDRVYDDMFDELADPPEFVLAGGGHRITVRFEAGYPVAQIYAPQDQDVICFEPMTAPTNALVTGGAALALVEPGDEYTARFSITVEPA
jgi:galactose mutarotase-like enzyme